VGHPHLSSAGYWRSHYWPNLNLPFTAATYVQGNFAPKFVAATLVSRGVKSVLFGSALQLPPTRGLQSPSRPQLISKHSYAN
jgi:hypothetical protein